MTTTEGFTDLPAAGTEVETLLGSLDRIRGRFAWKCGPLDAESMRATLGPSSMTLGGLLKHMAFVEDYFFTRCLWDRDLGPEWAAIDYDDPDWEWNTAADDSPPELMALWEGAVARSRTAVAEALPEGGLDRRAARGPWPELPSLRKMFVDVIEEYARHAGHADLIRESIDGLVGEDPPE
ncbi:DinB family protein [Nocardioides sp. LHG3406-4]|uniref:DinB family protein n=1 Tax=Nocardioides sp. LHG3406-4 TaxID=2804575 RepID=UPI003CF7F145